MLKEFCSSERVNWRRSSSDVVPVSTLQSKVVNGLPVYYLRFADNQTILQQGQFILRSVIIVVVVKGIVEMTQVVNGSNGVASSTPEDSTETVKKMMKTLVEANNHDRIFEKLRVISAGDGKFIGELVVEPEHTNIYGFLHGGYTASLVDVCGSVAMATHSNKGNGVSVDLNISFLNPGPLNETIVIESNTLKVGRTLGFVETVIRTKSSGKIIAKGSLTKHVQNSDKYSIGP